MIKTLCYIPLHYGKDYLKQAIQSVYNSVDEILILYTDKPCHGRGTNLECPDTKKELINVAMHAVDSGFMDDKIIWIDGNWNAENEQRNTAHTYARKNGFNVLVCVDADEIWIEKYLKELIQLTYDRKASKCLVWMRHLWRSFNFICDDGMRQERLWYIGNDTLDLIYAPMPENQMWHFGYARGFKEVEYKISIHGHSAEWLQPKELWFENKYKRFPPVDNVHPVCEAVWFPQPFHKELLPEFMRSHEYYNLDEIK